MAARRAPDKSVIERVGGTPIPYASDFELTALDELLPYAGNPKDHGTEQVRALAASLLKFGFMRPVVRDTDKTIRAGHGIVLGAQLIGATHAPTVCASHLSATELAAYVIADNRLAEHSTWNRDVLQVEVAQLQQADFDMQVLGFEVEELEFKDWDAAMEMTDQVGEHNRPALDTIKVVCPSRHHESVRAAIDGALQELDLDGVQVN